MLHVATNVINNLDQGPNGGKEKGICMIHSKWAIDDLNSSICRERKQ